MSDDVVMSGDVMPMSNDDYWYENMSTDFLKCEMNTDDYRYFWRKYMRRVRALPCNDVIYVNICWTFGIMKYEAQSCNTKRIFSWVKSEVLTSRNVKNGIQWNVSAWMEGSLMREITDKYYWLDAEWRVVPPPRLEWSFLITSIHCLACHHPQCCTQETSGKIQTLSPNTTSPSDTNQLPDLCILAVKL